MEPNSSCQDLKLSSQEKHFWNGAMRSFYPRAKLNFRTKMDLQSLSTQINKFTQARDWEQFHNPKDLAIALGIEVSELQEWRMA